MPDLVEHHARARRKEILRSGLGPVGNRRHVECHMVMVREATQQDRRLPDLPGTADEHRGEERRGFSEAAGKSTFDLHDRGNSAGYSASSEQASQTPAGSGRVTSIREHGAHRTAPPGPPGTGSVCWDRRIAVQPPTTHEGRGDSAIAADRLGAS
ncbi:MAG: hypothetical protein IPM29_28755 [Planctomycetes bacterium]|nr:hypothetical protein [Planctomycetota bacterium]